MKIGKWKLLSQKTLFKTPWWRLVKRNFKTTGGRKVDWFVLEKKNAVSVFCLTRGGKVVGIRYFRPGIRRIVLDIPTGYVDGRETPLEAAKRELKEETGFEAKKFVFLGKYAGNAQGETIMLYCFLALDGVKALKQKLDHGEEIETRLLTIPQLLKAIEKGRLLDATRVGVVFLALKKLGLLKVKVQ